MFQVEDQKFGATKYAGIMRGVVVDNADPDSLGRVRVKTPLFGESNWIPYLRIPGYYAVPEKDDVIFVQADGGDQKFLVGFGNLTVGADDENLPEDFKRSFPSNRGLYSTDGHLIELDDGTTIAKLGKGIRITTSDGSKVHILEDLTSKKILLERAGGQKVEIDELTDKITMSVAFGDEISISAADGLQGSTPTGTYFSFKAGEVEIGNNLATANLSAAGDIKAEGPTASLEMAASGAIDVKGPVGSLSIAASGGIEAKNATASLVITPAGQVELKGAAAGVVDLLIQAFTALSTQTAPGFGAPTSTVAQFAQLLALAQSLKA